MIQFDNLFNEHSPLFGNYDFLYFDNEQEFDKEEKLFEQLDSFDDLELQCFNENIPELFVYNSFDCFNNEQNDGFIKLTEIENSKFDSSKREIFFVDHYTNKSKKTKINKFINKKTKRKDNEININLKINTKKETNMNYKAENTFIKEGDAFPNSSNLKDRVLKPFCNSVVATISGINAAPSPFWANCFKMLLLVVSSAMTG